MKNTKCLPDISGWQATPLWVRSGTGKSQFTNSFKLITPLLFFLLSSVSAQSDWTWRNPWPTGNVTRDMVWTGEMIVGVGNNGSVATSPDGLDWTMRTTGEKKNYNGIAWNGNRFVAVGGRIMTSEDGVNWTLRIPDASQYPGIDYFGLWSVLWTGNQFVAVGEGRDSAANNGLGGLAGLAMTSPDGIEWQLHNTEIETWLWDVAWSEELNLLVAVGNYETILTSPDGAEWTQRNQNGEFSNQLNSVAWSGERFVVTDFGDGSMYTSEDGLTWTRDYTDMLLYNVRWMGSPDSGGFGFTALGDGFYTSPDGITWSRLSDPVGGGGVIWTGERLVTSAFSTSPDGVNWTHHRRDITGAHLYSVTWVPGRGAVAVGDSWTVLTSPDGGDWTRRIITGDRNGSGWLGSVSYGPGVGYVATGFFNGTIVTSPDGVDWTDNSIDSTLNLCCLTWMGDKFIMADWFQDTMLTTSDGINWTKHSRDYPVEIYGMTWTGEQVVAVGQYGAILTSPDGVDWTVRDSASGRYLYSVVWTGEQVVAVGSNGRVMTSPDGVEWTVKQDSITDEDLLSVTWSGKWLVAVARASNTSSKGNAYASSDGGVTWEAYPMGAYEAFRSVTWTGDKFITVGNDGAILTAPADGQVFVSEPRILPANQLSLRVGRDALYFSLPAGQAYPINPARPESYGNPRSGGSPEVMAVIYTLSGQRLFAGKQTLSGYQGTLSIGHLPPGPYLLELMVGGKRYNRGFARTR